MHTKKMMIVLKMEEILKSAAEEKVRHEDKRITGLR